MKTDVYIVVEDVADRDIIKSVINPISLENVKIETVRGKSAVISTARTILKIKQIPTVVVIDADSTDSEQIGETKSTYDIMLRQASENIPYKLLVSIPEIESVFFKDKKKFMRIFSRNIDDNQLALAMYDPKKVLRLTFQCSEKNMNIMRFVRNRDAVKELGQSYPFNELTDFLNEIKRSGEE